MFGHRGGNLGPENSLQSIRRSAEAGIDGVEIDMQLTADGRFVAHHDPLPDQPGSHAGTEAPELGAVLDLAATTGLQLLLDVKGTGDADREAAALADALRDTPAPVTVSSFDLPFLHRLATVAPELPLVPIISLRQNFWHRIEPDRWQGISILAAALPVRPLLWWRFGRSGGRRFIWFGVTEWPLLVRGLARLGADGLIIDDVDRGLELLGR
ncbi:MAG: glycerophosphodiester phosphodiesterase [Acidimicrobiales bacterium]